MRELTYFVAVSLDGCIAGPDGEFDAFPTEGDHIDMILRDYPDTVVGVGLDALGITATGERFDTVLMGWNTYAAGFAQGVRDPYPHLRQVVFSRMRGQADAAPGVTVTAESPVATVRTLKTEPGSGIWLCGGGQLAAELIDEIDRLTLKVNPIVLGDGIPLVAGGYDVRAFELTASTPYASGVVVNEYVRRRG